MVAGTNRCNHIGCREYCLNSGFCGEQSVSPSFAGNADMGIREQPDIVSMVCGAIPAPVGRGIERIAPCGHVLGIHDHQYLRVD